jgi:hypothetical protein
LQPPNGPGGKPDKEAGSRGHWALGCPHNYITMFYLENKCFFCRFWTVFGFSLTIFQSIRRSPAVIQL